MAPHFKGSLAAFALSGIVSIGFLVTNIQVVAASSFSVGHDVVRRDHHAHLGARLARTTVNVPAEDGHIGKRASNVRFTYFEPGL